MRARLVLLIASTEMGATMPDYAVPYYVITGRDTESGAWGYRERITSVTTWDEAVAEKADAERYGWTEVEIETLYYLPQTYEWEDDLTNA